VVFKRKLVLQNRQLSLAANRYSQFYNTLQKNRLTKKSQDPKSLLLLYLNRQKIKMVRQKHRGD
jgi:hypothetical protein